jgi:radical SAM protein with 4Fe4S-binding SPASM domain
MTGHRLTINRKAVLSDFFRFSHSLTFNKLINYTALCFSYFFSVCRRKAGLKGSPCSLTIEPLSICNLACPECPTGTAKLTRPMGVIRRNQFFSVVDQTYKKLLNLSLYFQGEPYLHPHFFDLISYAHDHNIYTSCSTNGHFLTEPASKRTIKSGLDRLIISVDGTDENSYRKYRSGGSFETVISGIKNIVALKKEMKTSNPLIIIQFLVLRTNEHLTGDIKALAEELNVDVLELKTARFNNFEKGNPLMPENEHYSRYKKTPGGKYEIKKSLKNSCFRMWSSSVVTWDGMLVPCCFDKDATHKLGDVTKNTFKEIWSSEEYDAFRNNILKERKNIEICRNCTT